MKYILCIIGLSIMMPVMAEQWQVLSETQTAKFMVDIDSIQAKEGLVYGKLRQIDTQSNMTREDAGFVFSCAQRSGILIEYAAFKKTESGQNKLQLFERQALSDQTEFEQILPGTYGDAVMSFSCTWNGMREQILAQLPIRGINR